MNYTEFRRKILNYSIIDLNLLKTGRIYNDSLKTQIQRWVKSGKLIKLRNNLYVLNIEDRKINPTRLFIANQIYKPSYISMEYALSLYRIIPEKTADITCITSKKTTVFNNSYGRFIYQHVQPRCFTGFIVQKDETNMEYFIAIPEKAVLDFIYLNLVKFKANYPAIFTESYRFQNIEQLDNNLLRKFSVLYNTTKLVSVMESLIKMKRKK